MIVHLNGRLIPRDQAVVSVFDRGFVFGDGVYEGLRAVPGAGGVRIVGKMFHVERLRRGLQEAGIGVEADFLGPASEELCRANGLTDAFVYWQVTRGTPGPGEAVRSRNPTPGTRPTVFGYCTPLGSLQALASPPTKRVGVIRDIRWELGHLKSTALMGNVLCALEAGRSGAEEAILVRHRGDQRIVSEGLATNVVLALPKAGGGTEVVTPSLESAPMLAGVTRRILLREVPGIVEREVLEHELSTASEVMLIGTTTYVTACTHVDGRVVGDGVAGPVARRLFGELVRAIVEGRDDG